MTCRDWLTNNSYEDVAALIDQAIAQMKARGSKQRRNWWDILSGGVGGTPCICEGIEFPVLRVAQKRQHKQVTKNAIAVRNRQEPPAPSKTGRWKKEEVAPKGGSSSAEKAHKVPVDIVQRRAS